MADQITNYKCPACTGPLHFAGSSGNMECEYCGSSFSVEEIEKMYADADEKAVSAKEKADSQTDSWEVSSQQLDGDGLKSYNCPSCGADLICDENLAASSCPYCGNPTIVPGQFSGMLKPDYVLPFKYEKKQALAALKNHYGNRFLLPKTFKDQNHLEEIKGVYVPFWLYDGTASGSCTFEAHEVETRKTAKEEITITKIYNVERSGNLAFEKIPADASTNMPDDLMDSIEPYNYDDLKPFTKAYLTGYLADKYDVSAEDNAERAVNRAKESTKNALYKDVTGYDSVSEKSADIHVEQGQVSYALMPVWLLNTKWNGQDFRFAMNGQTGKMVGDLPVDKTKLSITLILIFLASIILGSGLFGLDMFVSIIAGLIIAGVVGVVLHGSMKSVAIAKAADIYVKEDSVNITFRNDTYIRSEESRRELNS